MDDLRRRDRRERLAEAAARRSARRPRRRAGRSSGRRGAARRYFVYWLTEAPDAVDRALRVVGDHRAEVNDRRSRCWSAITTAIATAATNTSASSDERQEAPRGPRSRADAARRRRERCRRPRALRRAARRRPPGRGRGGAAARARGRRAPRGDPRRGGRRRSRRGARGSRRSFRGARSARRRHGPMPRGAVAQRLGEQRARRPGAAPGRSPAPSPPPARARRGTRGLSSSSGSRRLALLLERELGQRARLVGQPAGQQLVGDDAERVDVGAGAGLLAAGLLGRQIGGRAEHRADLGDARLVGGAGDPEVGELDDVGVGRRAGCRA